MIGLEINLRIRLEHGCMNSFIVGYCFWEGTTLIISKPANKLLLETIGRIEIPVEDVSYGRTFNINKKLTLQLKTLSKKFPIGSYVKKVKNDNWEGQKNEICRVFGYNVIDKFNTIGVMCLDEESKCDWCIKPKSLKTFIRS